MRPTKQIISLVEMIKAHPGWPELVESLEQDQYQRWRNCKTIDEREAAYTMCDGLRKLVGKVNAIGLTEAGDRK